MKTILIIGTGQIGKAILKKIVLQEPNKIIIHNLTKTESQEVVEKYKKAYKNIEFIESYGNIFLPYKLKNLSNKDLYDKSDEIINYFYSEFNEDVLKKSTIYKLLEKYKPELVIDAINTATVLGSSYNPEKKLKEYKKNIENCCKMIMIDDFTSKLISFVYSLKYSMEKFDTKKYIKVSTTGLGGMGLNMPYTHGDNPKMNLSCALMGKISASGVLHQLLWNLSHTIGINISIVIPATFVGYDFVKNEPIETDKGLLKRSKMVKPYTLKEGNILKYNVGNEDYYLEFPVVRAGENHVYSKDELKVLTSIGQMEAISKEEVASAVISDVFGSSKNNILETMDQTMLKPTYLGNEMIRDISNKIDKMQKCNAGIATGNLGITLSKHLYELYFIKLSVKNIKSLEKISVEEITKKINQIIDKDLITEIISLGIPIINEDNKVYIGSYSLSPAADEDLTVNESNINKWAKVGWVDLRRENIEKWINIIKYVWSDSCKLKENEFEQYINKNPNAINDDYEIADVLAYYYNTQNRGRKKY